MVQLKHINTSCKFFWILKKLSQHVDWKLHCLVSFTRVSHLSWSGAEHPPCGAVHLVRLPPSCSRNWFRYYNLHGKQALHYRYPLGALGKRQHLAPVLRTSSKHESLQTKERDDVTHSSLYTLETGSSATQQARPPSLLLPPWRIRGSQ